MLLACGGPAAPAGLHVLEESRVGPVRPPRVRRARREGGDEEPGEQGDSAEGLDAAGSPVQPPEVELQADAEQALRHVDGLELLRLERFSRFVVFTCSAPEGRGSTDRVPCKLHQF